jgi:hypothetical protein
LQANKLTRGVGNYLIDSALAVNIIEPSNIPAQEVYVVTHSMLYNLWHAHNDARETKRMEDPRTTAQKPIVVVEEWRNIQKPTSSVKPKQVEHWLQQEEDCVDGAFKISDGTGGGGVGVRDYLFGFWPHFAKLKCG